MRTCNDNIYNYNYYSYCQNQTLIVYFPTLKRVFIITTLRGRHYYSYLTEAETEALKCEQLNPDPMGSGRAWMQTEVCETLHPVPLVTRHHAGW